MPDRRPFWLIAALSSAWAAALPGCSPALDWRTVRPAHAPGLQALFPCKPSQLDRSLNLPGLPGAPVTVHLVSCQVGEATWALSHFDAQEVGRVPAGLASDLKTLRDNLEAATRLATHSPTTAVTAVDLGPTQVAGMTPNPQARHWRLQGQRPDGQGVARPFEVHAWHFSHGLNVYQATLWRPVPAANAKDSTEAAETFAQGFKFSD